MLLSSTLRLFSIPSYHVQDGVITMMVYLQMLSVQVSIFLHIITVLLEKANQSNDIIIINWRWPALMEPDVI